MRNESLVLYLMVLLSLVPFFSLVPYFTVYFLTILGVEEMYEEFLTGVLERLLPPVLLWNSIKLIIKIIIPETLNM